MSYGLDFYSRERAHVAKIFKGPASAASQSSSLRSSNWSSS